MPAYVIKNKQIIGPVIPIDPINPSGPTQQPTETYTDLSYIQGGGTNGPYIDTGVIAKANQGFILRMQISTNISAYIMGFLDFQNLSNHWNINMANDKIAVNVSDNDFHIIGDQTSNIIELNFNVGNNHRYYLTNSSGYTKTNNFSNSNNLHWLLFAYIYNNNIITNKSYKIYSCTIYESSTIIRNFKPVRRNSDNIIGMLDTINNIFYSSANSAVFTGG